MYDVNKEKLKKCYNILFFQKAYRFLNNEYLTIK